MAYLYDDFIIGFQQKIDSFFDSIKSTFNFDLGIEFEIQVCKLLRLFLPSKYGVCRGFVVNQQGERAGDDIIIFDQDRFPTLRLLPKDDFTLKEEIPIEAVYAYLEVKHNLTEEALAKALSQVIAVKKLVHQRKAVNIYQYDPYIENNLTQIDPIDYLPKYRNPLFCAIIGKFGNSSKDPNEVDDFLHKQIYNWPITNEYQYFPELIISGSNNIARTSYIKSGRTNPTIFHLVNNYQCVYQIIKVPNLAFAICFSQLMVAIDFIRLSSMPWPEIINNATGIE